jgi:NTP pyrophosphatase (non-canonical NTP hydrolase)
MGKFKDLGDPFQALAEECAEVIQVITKKQRFYGTWDEIPEGKTQKRKEELLLEMQDLIYQWERCKNSLKINQ